MKNTLLTERFQELAGIKPLHVTEMSLNEDNDYNEIMRDISNKMRSLPREEHKPFLEAIQKFAAAQLERL